jgi:predicted acetyltransferase
MTPQFEYSTLADPKDVKRLGDILDQCFISLSGNEETYIHSIGVDNFRVLHLGGQMVGGLGIISMAQWFGGASIPMTGIAAVGIAPEYRGDGAAITMMQHTVKELHKNGVPISVLYPATQRLYRKAGYEQAGAVCGWEIPTNSIQVGKQLLAVIRVNPIKIEVFYDLYQKQARLNNGNLDRNQFIWQRVSEPFEKEILYAYLIGEADQPQGYVIFSQHREDNKSWLQIRDWVLLTTAAVQSFWSFIATHNTQIEHVRWKSSVIDSLTLQLSEQTAKIKFASRWMLRVIDVVKALEKRGYPPGVEAKLHLEVQDDLLAENNGKFILSVANGRGEVTSGGKGELQLDIRGLAPLFTGLFTPHQLQLAGKLEATESALSAATQIFAGASPWMADFF